MPLNRIPNTVSPSPPRSAFDARLTVTHFTWQVLRTVKRSKKPPTGRALRLVPSRRIKDGTSLTELVDLGLLARVTGAADAPFEATYSPTGRGESAAEFGACEMPTKARPTEPVAAERPQAVKKGKGTHAGRREPGSVRRPPR